ncbi:phosphoenolpyruvate carboxykinase (ATP) [Candidatus Micrarchaeota archaeon]|nr:phosphoenolpyruvate carboxykinase (ATP) [Candidatus Micrarchaeota archaeon]
MVFEKALVQIANNADLIINPSSEELRELAKKEGEETEYGSVCYKTKVRGRSAKFTEIIEKEATEKQKETIEEVVEYLKGKKLIQLDREMCSAKPIHCRAHVSADYAHIACMWGEMLFIPTKLDYPDFNSVQIPEWPETKIIVDAEAGITFILGSDYTGELKKANLRLAMHKTKKEGGLGLHAGSKLIKVKKEGEIIEKGALLFGLSATGKTTLTCHHHWLDAFIGEGVAIRQDDVVLMQKDSSCLGTEKNFYIKTDGLEPENQPVLYEAAISKNALFENVKILPGGKIDFFDNSITSNGRAVVLRREMRHTDLGIDIQHADMVLFITRRDTIVPPVAKLNREHGAAFFMLGESIGSSASDVDPGKSRRVVGTNPFIIGSKDEEGNRFYDILRENPHIECYLLNTGSVGAQNGGPGEKITVHDSATIIKEIARETVKWQKDPDWGYEIADSVPEVEVSKFHPEKHYTKEKYAELTEKLRTERREWLAQFKDLYPEIKNAI